MVRVKTVTKAKLVDKQSQTSNKGKGRENKGKGSEEMVNRHEYCT